MLTANIHCILYVCMYYMQECPIEHLWDLKSNKTRK